MYVYDEYKFLKMCDKVSLENVEMIKFFRECQKNQEICDKAVDNIPMHSIFSQTAKKLKNCVIKAVRNYPSAMQFVPDQNRFEGTCNTAVNVVFFFI